MNNPVALWRPNSVSAVSDKTTNVPAIVGAAQQLRERERQQIAQNIASGNFEIATTFVWQKTMSLLKRQLATLGARFIGELLQRTDVDDYSDIQLALSDSEALSLARDLGMLTATQAMRLTHSQQVVAHFASLDSDDGLDDEEFLTREEAVSCLRVCVQGILGQEKISVASDFAAFRLKLESDTFSQSSADVEQLLQSPYFFKKTALSILISALREQRGAPLEHASRNALLIIPLLWPELKKPERWQIGQAYAAEFSEGNKDAIRALHSVLVAVSGFDFVPENLRSNAFIAAATRVIQAHQGMNNFYNEPQPMAELASLGTSIPGPAFAVCMTAVLCVKLGNSYGVSWNAERSADEVLNRISTERWLYYLNERLEQDRIILPKLTSAGPAARWIELIGSLAIPTRLITSRPVRDLIRATTERSRDRVSSIAERMWKTAMG